MMLNLQTLLTYNNTFGKHTVGALAGFHRNTAAEIGQSVSVSTS